MLLLDVLAAAVVAGVFWVPPTLHGSLPHHGIGLVLAAVAVAAMIARRRTPSVSTVAAGIATVAGSLLGVCQDPMLATAWCLFPLAVQRADRTRRLILILAGLVAALAAVTAVPPEDPSGIGRQIVVAVGALSVSWLLGTTVGRQAKTTREAERARVQLDVARDLHDVIGHALGAISAEAGVTRSLPDASEGELRESLADIEKHARSALQEIQGLVRGLRSGPGRPGPGIADLPAVIATTRAAGVPVRARIEVDEAVGEAVGAIVFRTVQEALSNVLRHAGGSGCTVDVCRDDGAIAVRVRDEGPGASGDRTGFGLRGMEERARLVGGTVRWHNHPDGGFEVLARLPVPGAG
jgi:signal transduction histidine kinase